jgi:very-short-patch-repair endonuclease
MSVSVTSTAGLPLGSGVGHTLGVVLPDHRLHRIATGQLGLFLLSQAEQCGFTERQLQHGVSQGRWLRVGRALYSMPGHEETWERRLLAAVMAVGPPVVVSHRSAARLLGLDGFADDIVEVTVHRGRRARTPLAIVHTSAALPRIDVIRTGRFSVTSGARTIMDLSSRLDDRQLAAAVGSALRDGWTSAPFLERRLVAYRGRRGRRALVAALEGPIGHSHLERRFLALVRGAGLPVPRTQVTYRLERVVRVDAVWEREWVVAEVMGHRFHCAALDLQRDAQRRNELQEAGFEVLEFPTVEIAHRPAAVVGRLTRTLIRRRDAFRRLASIPVTSA